MDHVSSSDKANGPDQDLSHESLNGVSIQSIQSQLEKILGSHIFINAERSSRFLRFTVEQAIQGRADQIKEYLVGLEVFDRSQSYDPRTDPIVRVEAGRLRTKLKEYYETEGHDDLVLITYRKGSYVPAFQRREAPASGVVASRSASPLSRWKAIALLALILSGSLIFWIAHRSPDASPPRQAGRNGQVSTIAVLPFESLSDDREQEHFADGMTEALITELSKIKRLQVISRTSTMHYKKTRKSLPEIVSELNANALVAGSVTFSGKRVRIIAHLMNASTDTKLWSNSYERDLQDILSLQSEVARTIAEEIKGRLEPHEK